MLDLHLWYEYLQMAWDSKFEYILLIKPLSKLLKAAFEPTILNLTVSCTTTVAKTFSVNDFLVNSYSRCQKKVYIA